MARLFDTHTLLIIGFSVVRIEFIDIERAAAKAVTTVGATNSSGSA